MRLIVTSARGADGRRGQGREERETTSDLGGRFSFYGWVTGKPASALGARWPQPPQDVRGANSGTRGIKGEERLAPLLVAGCDEGREVIIVS